MGWWMWCTTKGTFTAVDLPETRKKLYQRNASRPRSSSRPRSRRRVGQHSKGRKDGTGDEGREGERDAADAVEELAVLLVRLLLQARLLASSLLSLIHI